MAEYSPAETQRFRNTIRAAGRIISKFTVGVGLEAIYEIGDSLHYYDYPTAGANALAVGVFTALGAVGLKISRSTVNEVIPAVSVHYSTDS